MHNRIETYDQMIVNSRLKDFFGNHVEANLPRFRVSYSELEYEKRYFFEEIIDEEGKVTRKGETKVVPKYRWLNKQWVIERLFPNVHSDVMEGNYVYECIWALPEGRELNAALIIQFCQGIMSGKPKVPQTQKEADYIEQERLNKEKEETRNMIDTTSLETSLNDGSAEYFSGDINYKPSEQENKYE